MSFLISYFRPVVAFNKSSATTIKAANDATAGDTDLVLTNDAGYDIGDHVFISQADDTLPQYLGQITAVDAGADEITVEIPIQEDCVATSKVWQPTTYFRWTYGPGPHMNYSTRVGTEVAVSRGGQVYATKIGDEVDVVGMQIPQTWPEDFASLRDFLVTDCNGGTQFFSLGYWDYSRKYSYVAKVLCPDVRDLGLQMDNKAVGNIRFRFYIDTQHSYYETP